MFDKYFTVFSHKCRILIMAERVNLGIDFGTSNSSVGAVIDGKTQIVEVKDDKQSQPSSLFIRADGYCSTGFDAVIDFVSPETKTDTYHFVPSIKPGLPIENYEGIALKSLTRNEEGRFPIKFFEVEELAAFVISNLRQKAEKQFKNVSDKIVLGRPVEFSSDPKKDKLAQSRLEKAAKLAGFKSVHFIYEPIAAALYYERSRPETKAKNVFIFDFGGGTLDTCILKLGNSEKITEESLNSKVLSSHGVVLGGNDLDKDVFIKKYSSFFGKNVLWSNKRLSMPSYIYADLPEWHLADQLRKIEVMEFLRQISVDSDDTEAVKRLITLIQDQQVFAVLQSIEKGKIGLSSSRTSQIVYDYKNVQIDDSVTSMEFEGMIGSRKSQIQKCINECLLKAGLKAENVDAVLKVGGSSNNPFIDRLLSENFETKIEDDNIFTSVVAGLSIAASEIFE